VVAAVGFLIPPAAFQLVTSKTVDSIIRHPEDGSTIQFAPWLAWVRLGELDRLVWAYGSESDSQRRDSLASAYLKLTGESIQTALSRLQTGPLMP
jgi:hypothetical protein